MALTQSARIFSRKPQVLTTLPTATMLAHTLTHCYVEPGLLKPLSQLSRTLQGLTKMEGLGEPRKTIIWWYKKAEGQEGEGEREREKGEREREREVIHEVIFYIK